MSRRSVTHSSTIGGPGWEIIQPVSEHKRLSEVFSDATFARNHFECTREVHGWRGELFRLFFSRLARTRTSPNCEFVCSFYFLGIVLLGPRDHLEY